MSENHQVFPVVQPSEFQVNLAVACCDCTDDKCSCASEPYKHMGDDHEDELKKCQALNSAFTLFQTAGDPNKYECTFGETKPADATKVELVLSDVGSEEKPKYLACVSIYFEDAPKVSWIGLGFDDYTRIGTLRSRSRASNCCLPKTITVHAPPQPDFCAPHREWEPSHPDDLNDAPFFAQFDMDVVEDSPHMPIRYANGELNMRTKDLSSNGFGVPWGTTRIYSNRLSNNYDFGFGTNWMIHELPYLAIHQRQEEIRDAENDDERKKMIARGIAVVRGTRNALWFDEDDWYPEECTGDEEEIAICEQAKENWINENRTTWTSFTPRFKQSHVLKHFPAEKIFRLAAPNGHVWEFYDFNPGSDNPAPGRLKRHVGPGLQATEIQYESTPCRVKSVVREGAGVAEVFEFEYIEEGENFGRVRSVTHRRKGHQTLSGNIQKAVYSYYGVCDDKCKPLKYGQCGDLRFTAIQIPDRNDNARWQNLNIYYYQYLAGGELYKPVPKVIEDKDRAEYWQIQQLPYCQGLLYNIFGPESFRRLYRCLTGWTKNDEHDNSDLIEIANLTEDPEWIEKLEELLDKSEENDTKAPSELMVQYRDDRRIKRLSEASDENWDYSYSTNLYELDELTANCIAPPCRPQFNVYRYGTTESRPDGTKGSAFCNYLGQALGVRLGAEATSPSGSGSFSPPYCRAWVFHPERGGIMLQLEPNGIEWINEGFRTEFSPRPSVIPENSGFESRLEDLPKATVWGLNVNYDSVDGLVRVLNYFRQGAGGQAALLSLRKGVKNSSDNGIEDFLLGYLYDNFPWKYAENSETKVGFVRKKVEFIEKSAINPLINTTVFSYRIHHFWPDETLKAVQPKQIMAIMPPVPEEQNGDGKEGLVLTCFDTFGYPRWTKDARGVINAQEYDVSLGALTVVVEDVNSARPDTSCRDLPASLPEFGLHRRTTFVNDRFGRTTHTFSASVDAITEPGARNTRRVKPATRTVYKDIEGEIWSAAGYSNIESVYGFRLINPISIQVVNRNGQTECEIATQSPNGNITGDEPIPDRSAWSRFSQTTYDLRFRPKHQRDYFDIQVGKYHISTIAKYDALSRPETMIDEVGTCTRMIYEIRGLVSERWMGRLVGLYKSELRKVEINEYDKLGLLARSELLIGKQTCDDKRDDAYRIRTTEYDWRGRESVSYGASKSTIINRNDYGNLVGNIPKESFNYNGSPIVLMGSRNELDARGRIYQTVQFGSKHRPGTRRPVNSQCFDMTYDQNGNQISRADRYNHVITSTVLDGLERPTIQSVEWKDGNNTHLIEKTETQYDLADNPTLVQSTKNDISILKKPRSLKLATAFWHDPLGRGVASAAYGTAGPAQRPNFIPDRKDSLLVSETFFNERGESFMQRSPNYVPSVKGEQSQIFDDLGRPIQLIEASNSPARRRVADLKYNGDDQVREKTISNPGTGSQTTRYIYGSTYRESSVASGSLLREIIHPNSAVERFGYNGQGELLCQTDPNGTKHEFHYDSLGRMTSDSIIEVPEHVDSRVRRIDYSKDKAGRLRAVSCYDKPRQGGNGLNMIIRDYTDFELVSVEHQNHFSVEPPGRICKYEYKDHFQKGPRLDKFVYQGIIFQPSEVDDVTNGSGKLKRHSKFHYFGPTGERTSESFKRPTRFSLFSISRGHSLGAEIELLYQEYGGVADPTGRVAFEGAESFLQNTGSYTQRDGLGRQNQLHTWTATATEDHIQYEHDRANNVLTKRLPVATTNARDHRFEYDAHNRLENAGRGKLSDNGSFKNRDATESWGLDKTDNWKKMLVSDAEIGTDDLNQTRRFNTINQIVQTNGPDGWVEPIYDKAGNMVCMPSPSDPTKPLYCTYDAWHRMTKVVDDQNTLVAKYQYDGLGRRIVKQTSDKFIHYYYDTDGRVTEECETSSATEEPVYPTRQYYWGLDGRLACVDHSEVVVDGKLEYALRKVREFHHQDLLGSLTMVHRYDEDSKEEQPTIYRYDYSPYGRPKLLDNDFAFEKLGTYDAGRDEYLLGGYLYDHETGLYHTHHRQYHPLLGVWTSVDPEKNLPNVYAYTGDNPISRIDPLGADWLDDAANFAAGWGDELTLGLTNRAREGFGINDGVDQNSTAYKVGTGVGMVHSFGLGFGAAGALARGGRYAIAAARTAQGYAALSTGYGIGHSSYNIATGQATAWDALNFLPAGGAGVRIASKGLGKLSPRFATRNGSFALANEGVSGQAIDPTRFARMKAAFQRNGGVIDQSDDAQRYLRLQDAEGLTFNSKLILLPKRPTTTAVFEEFIHTAQHRTGRVTQFSKELGNVEAIRRLEIEAAEKLIRNRKAYRIPNAETRQTIDRLRRLRTP